MVMRQNISSVNEIVNLLLADAVLTVAFTMILAGGGIGSTPGGPEFLSKFLVVLPIAALGVALSFILHELMHKFVAQHYGAMAEFRTSLMGLAITLISGMFGFLIGIPGATYIYSNSFTKRQNGIVSLAGPATNLVIFFVFLAIEFSLPAHSMSYLSVAAQFIVLISIILAFFNMLPIYPLDGSKVLAWNPGLYAVVMVAIFILAKVFGNLPYIYIVFMIGIALFFSLIYRKVL